MEVLVTSLSGNIECPSRYIHVFATFSLRDPSSNVPIVAHLRNMFVLHILSQSFLFSQWISKRVQHLWAIGSMFVDIISNWKASTACLGVIYFWK